MTNKKELDRRVVKRNGINITFVKSIGNGDKARPHWYPVLYNRNLKDFIKWIGDEAADIICQFQTKLNTATDSGSCRVLDEDGNDLGPDIDANFEAFCNKISFTKQPTGGEAQKHIIKLKKMLLARGLTKEEIENNL